MAGLEWIIVGSAAAALFAAAWATWRDGRAFALASTLLVLTSLAAVAVTAWNQATTGVFEGWAWTTAALLVTVSVLHVRRSGPSAVTAAALFPALGTATYWALGLEMAYANDPATPYLMVHALSRGPLLVLAAAAAVSLLDRGWDWARVSLPLARFAFLGAALALAAETLRVDAQGGGVLLEWTRPYPLFAFTAATAALHGLIYLKKKRLMPNLAPAAALLAGAYGFTTPFHPNLTWAVTLFILVAAGYLAFAQRHAPQAPFLDHWIQMGQLVRLGMVLLMAFLAGATTLVLTPMGRLLDPSHLLFAVGVALLSILGLALSNQAVGRGPSLVATGVALLATPLLYTWQGPYVALLPPIIVGLLGSFIKLYRVADGGSKAPIRGRVAALFFLLSGFLIIAHWATPGAALHALHPLGRALPGPAAAWTILGLSAGIACLLASALAHRGVAAATAVGAGVFGLILGGNPGASLLALAAGLLCIGLTPWPAKDGAKPLPRDIRKTTTYTVHVGLVLVPLGFVAPRLPLLDAVPVAWSWAGLFIVTIGALALWALPERKEKG